MSEPMSLPDAPPGVGDETKSSYAQILRSSALLGGTSLLTLILGVLRTKVMALMLGPAGVGLMGTYLAIADLVRSVAEMGISQSGVRQVAAAVGSGNSSQIALAAAVLRRAALLLGFAGAAMLALFASPLGKLTFGNDEHTRDITLLGAVVLLNVVAGAELALLQGMRRIGDLAKIGALVAVLGTLAIVPIVYVFRIDGVVLSLIAVAVISTVLAWWFGRRLQIAVKSIGSVDMRGGALALLRLGLAFMSSAVLIMGAGYAVRAIVLRSSGLEAAGFYQAGWTVGGLFVGFILQAMGTDFYPRLVAQIEDHDVCNRLVNEQAHVSMLLAGPGIIATIVFAPLLVTAVYSGHFSEAVDVSRWICAGMALRIVTWPMAFIVVAKNVPFVFVAAELAWTIVNVGLSWILITRIGVIGAGIAFFGSYIFHAVMIYPIVRRLTGFTWSSENRSTALYFIGLSAVALVGTATLSSIWSTVVGLSLLVASCWNSLRSLKKLCGTDLPRPVARLLSALRLSAS